MENENELEVETAGDEALSPEESKEAGEEAEEEAGTDTESKKVETLDSETDYEAELEEERNRLGKKIDKERAKRIEAEKDKGLSREEVEALINEKVSQTEKRLLNSRADLIAEKLAKSPAEKKLILHHYEHSIIPTDNLEEDMEKAQALANRKRVSGQISELQKANDAKKRVISGNPDGGAPIEQKPKPKYSQEIIEAAKFAGVTPEEFVKKQR